VTLAAPQQPCTSLEAFATRAYCLATVAHGPTQGEKGKEQSESSNITNQSFKRKTGQQKQEQNEVKEIK
jgi:hypothetical protein